MLTTQKKNKIIKDFKVHNTDTGSPEVMIALVSVRLDELAEHLKNNKKDKHSRRGLIGLVSKRRKMLAYLKKKDAGRYEALIKKLGLKK